VAFKSARLVLPPDSFRRPGNQISDDSDKNIDALPYICLTFMLPAEFLAPIGHVYVRIDP